MSRSASRSPSTVSCAQRRRVGARLAIAGAVAAALVGTPQGGAVTAGANGDIAFDSRRAGETDVYVVGPDGSGERRLNGNEPGAVDARPTWTPAPGVSDRDLIPFDAHAAVGAEVELGGLNGRTATAAWVGATPVAVTDGKFTVPPEAQTGYVCVEIAPTIPSIPIPARVRSVFRLTVGDTPAGPDPVYCPSQPITFQSDRTGDFDIWTLDPAPTGSAAFHLLPLPGSDETAPAWSPGPDSTLAGPGAHPLLAFESDRGGTRDIWLFDPAQPLSGTNPAQLTSGPADDANPDWSPNGSSIAFESNRDGQKDIWVIEVVQDVTGAWAAAELRKVTFDQPPSYEPSWFAYALAAPAFDQIASSGPAGRADCELNYVEQQATDDQGSALLGAGFRNPETIAAWTFPGEQKEDAPAYSPYGDRIAFHSNELGSDDIWTLQVASSHETEDPIEIGRRLRVTSTPGADRNPAWQPLYLSAQVSFRRPWGRASRRRRGLSASSRSAAVPVGGCAETPRVALAVVPTAHPGDVVVFDASESSDPDGSIARFEWDLDGDGSFETPGVGPLWQQAFAAPGLRTVAVRVTDDDGLQASTARTIEIVARTHELVVSKAGAGTGTVSSPDGIDCGADCSEAVEEHVPLTLTATAGPASRFEGWTGCDSTSADECTVSLTGSRTVVATFARRDVIAPATRIRSGPRASTTAKRATFRFTANEQPARFQCKLDHRRWTACRSPRSYTVAKGRHTFRVRAIDAEGNVDPTPATRRWRRR